MATNFMDEAINRAFGDTDKIISAIENGEDPTTLVARMESAAPWHLVSVGQAFVKDSLVRHKEADDELASY